MKQSSGGAAAQGKRSESDKEKTKLRERQRRAITSKIFHGLRKHGGYHLSPRADINEVLRHLASESGWIIQPDGTTYRSSNANLPSKALPGAGTGGGCPMCGGGGGSATATPSSSAAVGCSTTSSPQPHRFPPQSHHPVRGAFGGSGAVEARADRRCGGGGNVNVPLELYMYGSLAVGGLHNSPITTSANIGDEGRVALGYQLEDAEEVRASGVNIPINSHLRRPYGL